MSFYRTLEKKYNKDRIGTLKEILPECIQKYKDKEWISLIEFGTQMHCLRDEALNEAYFDRLEKFINKKRQVLIEKSSKMDSLENKFVDYLREAWNSYTDI